MSSSRAKVVSSFTIIKGSLIDETYDAFANWDFVLTENENLRAFRESNPIGATSANWLRDVSKVLHRRFDPDSRDRPLIELARAGCDRDVWKPILLWHMTRDEFLLRDFLVHWLYKHYVDGAFRLHSSDVEPYLKKLSKHKSVEWSGSWTDSTTARVAAGLLRIACDFGLMKGSAAKEFASYHLPDESLLYILIAMSEQGRDARRLVSSPDWHMFMMSSEDVERELLRLHQFRKLHYEVAGSLTRIGLPFESTTDYARELVP